MFVCNPVKLFLLEPKRKNLNLTVEVFVGKYRLTMMSSIGNYYRFFVVLDIVFTLSATVSAVPGNLPSCSCLVFLSEYVPT